MLVKPTPPVPSVPRSVGGLGLQRSLGDPPHGSPSPCSRPSQRRCGGGARGSIPGAETLRHRGQAASGHHGQDPRLTSSSCAEVKTRPRDADTLPRVPSYLKLTPSSKSRPIAIDIPSGRRRAASIPASEPVPLEPPLSARGDIAG